jgi:hypothetical protein
VETSISDAVKARRAHQRMKSRRNDKLENSRSDLKDAHKQILLLEKEVERWKSEAADAKRISRNKQRRIRRSQQAQKSLRRKLKIFMKPYRKKEDLIESWKSFADAIQNTLDSKVSEEVVNVADFSVEYFACFIQGDLRLLHEMVFR